VSRGACVCPPTIRRWQPAAPGPLTSFGLRRPSMSNAPTHVAIVHLVPIWRVCSTPTRRTDRDGARIDAIRLPTWTTRCEDWRDVVPAINAIHEASKGRLD
jgi:hypothetical protein